MDIVNEDEVLLEVVEEVGEERRQGGGRSEEGPGRKLRGDAGRDGQDDGGAGEQLLPCLEGRVGGLAG